MLPVGLHALHLREEDHLFDRAVVGQEHDKPVDADADAAGRGHTVAGCVEDVAAGHPDSKVTAITLISHYPSLFITVLPLGDP